MRLVLAAIVGLLAMAGTAGAETSDLTAARAQATAEGIRTSLTMPGFLVVESVFDGGGPVARSVLDSAGGASFASLPYPGETAMSVPGLIAAGGGPALPAYPLYVSATSSQPEQGLSDPVGLYALRAVVSETGGAADSRLGSHGQAVVSGSQTHTEVSRTVEAVSATAESVTEGIVVAEGALRIGSVRSRSRTVLQQNGSMSGPAGPQTTTELVVEGGRAGPLSFSLGPDGLEVNGSPVPIPACDGLAAVNQALAPAGVKLGIIRGEDVPGGRSSDVLFVEQQVPLPTGQPGVLRLSFGGTTTAAGGSPLAADLGGGAPAGPPEPVAPITEGSTGGSVGEAPTLDQPAATRGPDPVAPSGPAPNQRDVGSPGPGFNAPTQEAAAPAVMGGPPTGGLAATRVGVAAVRFSGLRVAYWALASVAGVLVLGSWRWRTRGARRP